MTPIVQEDWISLFRYTGTWAILSIMGTCGIALYLWRKKK
jgi:Mg2+ and Co2+ transporter CorA